MKHLIITSAHLIKPIKQIEPKHFDRLYSRINPTAVWVSSAWWYRWSMTRHLVTWGGSWWRWWWSGWWRLTSGRSGLRSCSVTDTGHGSLCTSSWKKYLWLFTDYYSGWHCGCCRAYESATSLRLTPCTTTQQLRDNICAVLLYRYNNIYSSAVYCHPRQRQQVLCTWATWVNTPL